MLICVHLRSQTSFAFSLFLLFVSVVICGLQRISRMQKILVAVGSTRRPKLNAVWEGLTVFGPSLDPNGQFEVVGVEVESGVGHTPTTRAELMAGARGRAEALSHMAQERDEAWRYFVGLEGGLDVVGKLGLRRGCFRPGRLRPVG
ncbi:MAG: hypothetical protein DMG29_20355 [Acidobacteria bacterium]|nr:MAG: hypothetical protein DMG29_20355 [Acidobacteriota bacterium]